MQGQIWMSWASIYWSGHENRLSIIINLFQLQKAIIRAQLTALSKWNQLSASTAQVDATELTVLKKKKKKSSLLIHLSSLWWLYTPSKSPFTDRQATVKEEKYTQYQEKVMLSIIAQNSQIQTLKSCMDNFSRSVVQTVLSHCRQWLTSALVFSPKYWLE